MNIFYFMADVANVAGINRIAIRITALNRSDALLEAATQLNRHGLDAMNIYNISEGQFDDARIPLFHTVKAGKPAATENPIFPV